MSAPFMQLYVADYLGDTRHLTTEQHGAYLLLLMTMWRSDGRLPNDDKKLARITGCTASRWSRIKDDVLAFFDVDGDDLVHGRVTLELEKASEKAIKRADAGSRGGMAKARKTKDLVVANATDLLWHSSDIRSQSTEADASVTTLHSAHTHTDLSDPPTRDELDGLQAGLRRAAGSAVNAASPGLLDLSPVVRLLRAGSGPACDVQADVIPTIQARSARAPPGSITSWAYFAPAIIEARDRRLSGAPAQRPANDRPDHHHAKPSAREARIDRMLAGAVQALDR